MTSFYYIYFLNGKANYVFIKAHGVTQAVAMARRKAPEALKAGRRWMCVQARRRYVREGVRLLISSVEDGRV